MQGTLKNFDLPSDSYADDVALIMGECLKRNGEREWKAVVLTNEIHGHLGIYSTLGAKMGLRAREWFEAQGIEGHIHVLSFAGSTPPVSCLNDGLQVSTGASLGHGLIAVSDEPATRPEAIFTCGERSIRLALKPEYAAQIRTAISDALSRFGSTPRYWQRVRDLALNYWCLWHRREIFSEVQNIKC